MGVMESLVVEGVDVRGREVDGDHRGGRIGTWVPFSWKCEGRSVYGAKSAKTTLNLRPRAVYHGAHSFVFYGSFLDLRRVKFVTGGVEARVSKFHLGDGGWTLRDGIRLSLPASSRGMSTGAFWAGSHSGGRRRSRILLSMAYTAPEVHHLSHS